LALPAAAQQGDPRPGFAEILAPDRLAGIVANFGIAALRTQMEVEYQHLSTDILRGQISLSGVTLRPQLPYDRARQCEITLDRVTISGNPFAVISDVSAARIGAVGAAATLACLPPETALPIRSTGLTEIAFDRVGVDLEYVTLTGAMLIDATAALNGIGVLDLSAAGTLLPRPGANGMPGDPAEFPGSRRMGGGQPVDPRGSAPARGCGANRHRRHAEPADRGRHATHRCRRARLCR
jgi:hypothetical protein